MSFGSDIARGVPLGGCGWLAAGIFLCGVMVGGAIALLALASGVWR